MILIRSRSSSIPWAELKLLSVPRFIALDVQGRCERVDTTADISNASLASLPRGFNNVCCCLHAFIFFPIFVFILNLGHIRFFYSLEQCSMRI